MSQCTHDLFNQNPVGEFNFVLYNLINILFLILVMVTVLYILDAVVPEYGLIHT